MQIDSRTELVVASDIARRLGVSRQRINQLQAQQGFPKPIGRLANSNVWRWTQIERWAEATGRVGADGARLRPANPYEPPHPSTSGVER